DYYPPEVGATWLRQQPSPRVLVVPSVPQADYIDGLPGGAEVATPRNRYRRATSRGAAVLVVFPGSDTLEVAEALWPRAVCVADNGNNAVRAWVAQHDARGLVPSGWDGELPEFTTPTLPED